MGLSRHRALLFKFLADASNLKCRVLRGPYTGEVCSLFALASFQHDPWYNHRRACMCARRLTQPNPPCSTLQFTFGARGTCCHAVPSDVQGSQRSISACGRCPAGGPEPADTAAAIILVGSQELLVDLILSPGACLPLHAVPVPPSVPAGAPDLAQAWYLDLLPFRIFRLHRVAWLMDWERWGYGILCSRVWIL